MIQRTLIILTLSNVLSAQFVAPSWRGDDETEFAKWNLFLRAYDDPEKDDFLPNLPNSSTLISQTNDEYLFGREESAFLTSGANIYSFSNTTKFEITDSANYEISTIVLQLNTLGSGLDLDSPKLRIGGVEFGSPQVALTSSAELGGEFGGNGDYYSVVWDFDQPLPSETAYSIVFQASASSMSLSEAVLDTRALVVPDAPRVQVAGDSLTISWSASEEFKLFSTTDLSTSTTWSEVSQSPVVIDGIKTVTIAKLYKEQFFRLIN